MVLIIPPVDGIYHAWKPGDTLEKVSKQFDAQQEDITNFAGNKLDFASMYVEAGTMIMIPGGTRDINRWQSMIIIDQRPDPGQNANDCRSIENPIATSLTWPKDQYYIFGNEYSPGHLGLDIQADEGEPIYPVGSGIVTHAASGWNYGYGNVVQVDHGNGYVTVYAFLRSYNVSRCDIVNQGDMIGRAGVSEFSPYTYFHFEIRSRGSIVNPYEIIQ